MIQFVSFTSIRALPVSRDVVVNLYCPNPPETNKPTNICLQFCGCMLPRPCLSEVLSFFMGTDHLRRNPVRLQPVREGWRRRGGLRHALCNGSRGGEWTYRQLLSSDLSKPYNILFQTLFIPHAPAQGKTGHLSPYWIWRSLWKKEIIKRAQKIPNSPSTPTTTPPKKLKPAFCRALPAWTGISPIRRIVSRTRSTARGFA